jgi:hypothetical protein
LKLNLKPPVPGVTGISSDRFIDDDRIESTLLVQNAKGQMTRDMQATWVRKSSTIEEDILLSRGPAETPAELAVLQKLAGDWSIRQTMKPSVWVPDGKIEKVTEQVAWVLGGKFLIFRAFDEQQQMLSLSLMTYEPKENSYRFRHFAKGVYGGQWSVTWDDTAQAFHWRATGMPNGLVGTGINRWIDDNTFDNQALIKDDQGRVLLDSQQDKKRVK